jgi:hypothetical protein
MWSKLLPVRVCPCPLAECARSRLVMCLHKHIPTFANPAASHAHNPRQRMVICRTCTYCLATGHSGSMVRIRLPLV